VRFGTPRALTPWDTPFAQGDVSPLVHSANLPKLHGSLLGQPVKQGMKFIYGV